MSDKAVNAPRNRAPSRLRFYLKLVALFNSRPASGDPSRPTLLLPRHPRLRALLVEKYFRAFALHPPARIGQVTALRFIRRDDGVAVRTCYFVVTDSGLRSLRSTDGQV